MPKRKIPVPRQKQPGPTVELRRALMRQKKAELVEFLMELAEGNRKMFQRLTVRFHVVTTPDDPVAATRRAIADATDFDERGTDLDFTYDDEAYKAIERNLRRLVDSRQLRPAMELAPELMKQGSYQVEMSEEGLMSEDIEDCLDVVIQALTKCDLPAAEVIDWCSAMTKNDRLGFIADKAIQSLRARVQARTGP